VSNARRVGIATWPLRITRNFAYTEVCGAPHTSVNGRHLILNGEPARLAHMARYAVRAPVAMDRIRAMNDGRVLLEIPPDPKTCATVLTLDPLEWARRITNQIPDPKMHMTSFYGAYSNRARKIVKVGSNSKKSCRMNRAFTRSPPVICLIFTMSSQRFGPTSVQIETRQPARSATSVGWVSAFFETRSSGAACRP